MYLITDENCNRISRLITSEEFKAYKHTRSGRSTAILHKTIGECYANVGEWVDVVDHVNSKETNRFLLQRIGFVIKALKYMYFEYDLERVRVRFNPSFKFREEL